MSISFLLGYFWGSLPLWPLLPVISLCNEEKKWKYVTLLACWTCCLFLLLFCLLTGFKQLWRLICACLPSSRRAGRCVQVLDSPWTFSIIVLFLSKSTTAAWRCPAHCFLFFLFFFQWTGCLETPQLCFYWTWKWKTMRTKLRSSKLPSKNRKISKSAKKRKSLYFD